MSKTLIKWLLPLVVIAVAGGVVYFLVLNKKAPRKKQERQFQAVVKVQAVKEESRQIMVQAYGEVEAVKVLRIVPEVTGRVVYIHPDLSAGNTFKKGDVLFATRATGYASSRDAANTSLREAELNLAKVEGEARVAKMQWELWKKHNPDAPEQKANSLVSYDLQIKHARARLEAAETALKQAGEELEQTRFKAPYDSVVMSVALDMGQYIRSGEEIGKLMGVNNLEVSLPVNSKYLEWLMVDKDAENASPVIINMKNSQKTWKGTISRLLPEVDTVTRMPVVIATLMDTEHLPVGAFVEASIQGKTLESIFPIPVTALKNQKEVWLFENNRLKIQPVKWVDGNNVEHWITEGLKEGDRVITSALTGVVEGMPVQLAGNRKGSSSKGKGKSGRGKKNE